MAANFEVSPELRVLWQQYNILVDAIANYNPLEVALEARSRGVLPRDWIGLTGGTPVQKTSVLLSALSDRVKESSLVFYQFVELLKAHPPLSQLAILMEQRCREEVSASNTSASNLAASAQQKYLQLQQQMQQLQQQQLALQQHWPQLTQQHSSQQFPATPFQTSDGHPHFSHGDHHISNLHPSVSAMTAQGLAASHIPQSVPITSSLPLQGSNLQPQHSLGSHNTLASGYPPGINARDIDTSMVPGPGGMYMSQPHYAVPIASSLPLQGSNLQSQHRLSSHNTLASRYPPVPTASYLPLQRSSLQPQHSLSSHNTLASRYHPGIHTPGIDMSTVPRPGVPAASPLPLQGSNLQLQHSLSSHSTQASRYPPGSSTSNIDASVPGPGDTCMSQPHYPVPTASPLPLQGSNLLPQHNLGSHSSQASRYPPDITTTSIDTSTVPQPSVPATPFQTSDGHPHFSHGDHHISSLHPSVSAMAAQGLAASHIPQSVPITSSLPLQGTNLQPQHSLGSHNILASGHPPGINARDIDASMVPGPGGMYMSQPHFAVPTASSLPLQGSNLQSQHILSSHSTLASRYPPVPTASPLPLQGSNIQPQHSLGSHGSHASRYPPNITTTSVDTSTVSGPSGQDVLTLNELYDVLNELHVVRAKWHVLGGSLKVKESVLAAIRAEFRDIPDNCLREMLSHWLKQVTSRPCWSAIVAALRMPIVYEPQLAQTLEAKYCPGNTSFQSQHSHVTDGNYLYQGYSSQESNPFPSMGSGDISVLEERPPSQKIPRISSGPEILSSGASLSQEREGVSTDPFTLYGQKVKSIYLKQPDIPQDDWPPVRKSHYVNLALLKNAAIKDDHFARFTIRGSLDDILRDKEELHFSDVFVNADMGHRILFEGRPGSGKTTLMHKISKDWAKGELLKHITVFILIQLRAYVGKDDVTLHDIVGVYRPLCIHNLCTAVEQIGGEGICIGIDGLDEYSSETLKTSFIYNLIKGKVLPKAMVIIASRPAASQKFRRCVDRNVEVLGFLKPQIAEYITDYYSDNSTKAEGLITYLEEHPNVKHACYIPLHLAMVAYLFDHYGFSLPERETEIYRHFTLSTLVRALEREQEVMDSEISDFTDLSPKQYEMFMQVCELAFKATLQQKLVYSLKEAKSHFNVDPQGKYLGLIAVDRQYVLYGREETYSFLHLTLQEFLAAYHLTQLREEYLMSFIEEYTSKAHMFEVFKFYFGLTQVGKPAAEKVLKRFLDANKSDTLLLVQCAFESQNAGTCQLLASKGDGIIDIQKKTLNPSDFTALGYVTRSASSALRETHIVSCSVTSEGLQALIKATDDCSLPGEVLNLHGTRLKIDVAQAAADFLKKALSVKHLRLSKCGIQLATLSQIAPVLSRMTSLVSLRLEQNDLGVKSFPVLLDVMKMLTNLEELSTDHQFLENLDSPFSTSQSLMKLSLYAKIKIIDVSRSYTAERKLILLHSEPTQAVLPWLVSLVGELAELRVSITDSNSTGEVKHLNLKEIRLDYLKKPVNSHILEKLVEVCPNLTVLSLDCNNIGPDGAKSLCLGLQHCTSLQTLNLAGNNIGPDGAKSLCLGLEYCTSLQTLNLRHNAIGESGGAALGEVLKNCPELQSLNLGGNNIGPDGTKSLCLGLKHCTSLQELYLWDNGITDDAVDSLMELLKTMKDLKKLYLRRNHITDDAVDSLMELLKTMKDLKEFDLMLNRFTESGKTTLRQAAEARKEQSNFISLSV